MCVHTIPLGIVTWHLRFNCFNRVWATLWRAIHSGRESADSGVLVSCTLRPSIELHVQSSCKNMKIKKERACVRTAKLAPDWKCKTLRIFTEAWMKGISRVLGLLINPFKQQSEQNIYAQERAEDELAKFYVHVSCFGIIPRNFANNYRFCF